MIMSQTKLRKALPIMVMVIYAVYYLTLTAMQSPVAIMAISFVLAQDGAGNSGSVGYGTGNFQRGIGIPSQIPHMLKIK